MLKAAITALLLATSAIPAKASDRAPYSVPHSILPSQTRGRSFGKARYALLVSLDGVSHRLFRYYIRGQREPTLLHRLAKEGFARGMQTVFPSVTWPAHVTMVTGQYPEVHGVLGNHWLENYKDFVMPYRHSVVDEERFRRTPALYDLAAAKGWVSAALNWPGTHKARNLRYNMPETMRTSELPFKQMSPELQALVKQMYWRSFGKTARWPAATFSPRNHLDSFIGRVARTEKMEVDMLVRDLTVRLVKPRSRTYWPRDKIPRILMTHLLVADTWAHKYATSPFTVRWAFEQIEYLLTDIINAYKAAGIWKQTVIFIVSDHGFINVRRRFDMNLFLRKNKFRKFTRVTEQAIREDAIIPANNSQTSFIYARQTPQKQEVLRSLTAALKQVRYKPCIKAVYSAAELPKLGLPSANAPNPHPGAPDLLVLAQPTCYFSGGHRRAVMVPVNDGRRQKGSHGYLPTHSEMISLMLARGPGIKRINRWLRTAHAVDIAPTIAYLLGLQWPRRWPKSNGKQFKLAGRILTDVVY